MKPTLFAIATVLPLLAGVIPAHAVECAVGVATRKPVLALLSGHIGKIQQLRRANGGRVFKAKASSVRQPSETT
jgi:hypothetical protein